MTANVVIVESPAKARTLEKYLGPDYRVLASYGHVRDLPAKDGSVKPDEDFAMVYETEARAAKHLAAIAEAVKGASNLFLATDPDREGEAISWHVVEELVRRKALRDIPVKRVAFHEITKGAVREAMAHPRDLDMDLINAQQARRALDYLVGFTLSPVLWRKLPGSRSAGRVQSVALRLICDREIEIEAFKPREYWTIDAGFATPAGAALEARLNHLHGNKLDKFDLADEAAARAAVAAVEARDFAVAEVERKKTRRNPSPPFTTSTLQQEASRKLGFGARRTMQIAQRLYEGITLNGETVGLITYMRTDSVHLAREAVGGCREMIGRSYGDAYLPAKPRSYRATARNAQEAHEAIRPTAFGRRPDDVARHLDAEQRRLYELIWKRAVASQMESAVIDQVAVDIASPDDAVRLRATGSTVAFDGYLKLYREGRDDNGNGDDEGRRLPPVDKGAALARGAVTPAQHFTEPPPRYSEATLVKKLEELGIGRPSTYASILSVLQDRDYVRLEKKRFVPEDRGRLVTAFLESFFSRYVEYDFTARLEDRLDEISNGRLDWKDVLRSFWIAFKQAVAETGDLRVAEVLDALNRVLGPHVFRDDGSGRDPRACPACADGRLNLKIGKFGAFVGCSNYPDCRYTRAFTGEGSGADGGNGADAGPRMLGDDPATGKSVSVRRGPYGYYVQLGEAEAGNGKPKRATLPKGLPPDDIDLEKALGLLALPREIGRHPETGEPILAGIGRFGPYLKYEGAYVSLPAGDDVLAVGLNRAVALIAENKKRRRASGPLREIGPHPKDGKPVTVMKGRYGPYLRHDGVNAPLPKSASAETIALEEAVAQIAAHGKPARGRARKSGGAKKATAKAPRKSAKKAAVKKASASKAPAPKPPAKKTASPPPVG
ncbi:MAG: type I DNA topoisomerase [Alphaproteobacteria bacterium]